MLLSRGTRSDLDENLELGMLLSTAAEKKKTKKKNVPTKRRKPISLSDSGDMSNGPPRKRRLRGRFSEKKTKTYPVYVAVRIKHVLK